MKALPLVPAPPGQCPACGQQAAFVLSSPRFGTTGREEEPVLFWPCSRCGFEATTTVAWLVREKDE